MPRTRKKPRKKRTSPRPYLASQTEAEKLMLGLGFHQQESGIWVKSQSAPLSPGQKSL